MALSVYGMKAWQPTSNSMFHRQHVSCENRPSILPFLFPKSVRVAKRSSLTVSGCTIGLYCLRQRKSGPIRSLKTRRTKSSRLWSLVRPTISFRRTWKSRVREISSESKLSSVNECNRDCPRWPQRIKTASQAHTHRRVQPWICWIHLSNNRWTSAMDSHCLCSLLKLPLLKMKLIPLLLLQVPQMLI